VENVERIFVSAAIPFGNVDILVNNAGVYKFGAIEEVTESEYRRHFDTNVLGLLLATKAVVSQFGPESGSIVNIGQWPAGSRSVDGNICRLGDCGPTLDLLADDRIELLRRCRFREDPERPDLFDEFRRRHHAADVGGDLLDHGRRYAFRHGEGLKGIDVESRKHFRQGRVLRRILQSLRAGHRKHLQPTVGHIGFCRAPQIEHDWHATSDHVGQGGCAARAIRLRHGEHCFWRVIYGGAAQFTAFAEVEATSAMDCGTVVPHNKVSNLPLVRVYALALRGMLEQVG
jgi:hypothetical protein